MPEESDATRAINAAASVLLAFFDSAAHQITEAILGPRPALVEAYRRHRRSDARGEDAAAALFGISTQGEHHDQAAPSSRRWRRNTLCVYRRATARGRLPVRPNSVIRTRGTNA